MCVGEGGGLVVVGGGTEIMTMRSGTWKSSKLGKRLQ